jgi:adenine-specific DNA glycosylase
LLTQRATTGHWAAMWELPSVESESPLNDGDLLARLSIPVAKLRFVESFTHLLSHREIRFRIYRGTTRQRRGAWRTPEEIDDVAMSSAMRRAIQRRIAIQDEASRGSSVVSASS